MAIRNSQEENNRRYWEMDALLRRLEPKLAPCPWCGKRPIFLRQDGTPGGIWCVNPDCAAQPRCCNVERYAEKNAFRELTPGELLQGWNSWLIADGQETDQTTQV